MKDFIHSQILNNQLYVEETQIYTTLDLISFLNLKPSLRAVYLL